MKFGFWRTAMQAVCTVIALTAMIGSMRLSSNQTVRAFNSGQQGVSLPIIMYHSVLKDAARQGKYVISPEVLAQDLDYLKSAGYQTITITDLLAYVQQGTPLPEKPIMITFDDGYYNNYAYAYPLLQQRDMRAIVSVIGSQTDAYTRNGQENAYWSHLKLSHLLKMSDVFEVQNHSWNLHEYGDRRGCLRRRGEDAQSYANLLKEDTQQTQTLLIEAGVPEPTCYTFPYGACSKESNKIIREMGFLSTLGCEERMNTITRDAECLYQMGRYNRPAGMSTAQFMKKVLGE